MKEKFVTDFEETTKELLSTLSAFSEQDFNKIPFEGSWTAGQVAEHLYKSESGIATALNGNSVPAERDPLQYVNVIQKVFLDFTTKLKSPEFILPSNEPKKKDHLIKGFEATRRELQNSIETKDLNRMFTDFSFPQLGTLTGRELICFAICHSKRHIHQMKTIAEKLKVKEHQNVRN